MLVIGGGPAGMEAAITARQRGFDAEAWEASDRLVGTLWPAGGAEFKKDIVALIESMAHQCEKLGVDIKLNHPATEENLAGKSFDKVILAAGSTPAMPPIEGIEMRSRFARVSWRRAFRRSEKLAPVDVAERRTGSE